MAAQWNHKTKPLFLQTKEVLKSTWRASLDEVSWSGIIHREIDKFSFFRKFRPKLWVRKDRWTLRVFSSDLMLDFTNESASDLLFSFGKLFLTFHVFRFLHPLAIHGNYLHYEMQHWSAMLECNVFFWIHMIRDVSGETSNAGD